MNNPITAIVLSHNEEKTIAKCLKNLSWCGEILVFDDNSNDNTIQIAKAIGARVIERSLSGDFAEQRNAALHEAKGEWVLFVDADEEVSLPLSYEILSYVANPMNTYSGFYLKRKDVLWGRPLLYGETASLRLLRLAKRDAGKWAGAVHERWVISGQTGVLRNELLHFPHQTIGEFLREINWYTDLRAIELHQQRKRSGVLQIIAYPAAKFIQNYIIRLGMLDGVPGIIVSLMMSFHSFLVRGKLWQLQKNA